MHTPVMLTAIVDALQLQPCDVVVDGTLGRGGHAQALLACLGDGGRLYGCDRDPEALRAVAGTPLGQDQRCHLLGCDFASLPAWLCQHGLAQGVNAMMLDFGVSSPQIDTPERGFSFQHDGPLDMRMNPDQTQSAATWLASASEQSIAEVLWRLGEERYARRIAGAIVKSRVDTPILRTQQLVDLIVQASPRTERHKHPATRSFQAIRMHINDELGQLERFLEHVPDILAPGGRLTILTFHSLEDRVVKQWMRKMAQGPAMPAKLPVKAKVVESEWQLISRKPIVADAAEICDNPRSRSAKLRVIRRRHD